MFWTLITILPIFSLILLGKLLKSTYFKSNDFWRYSEKMTYYVLFPALLINSLTHTNFHAEISHAIFALVAATTLLAATLISAQFFLKMEVRTFTSLFQGAVRYNSYIFIGVSSALYGADGIAIVAIIIAYMIILTNVMSVLALDIYLKGNIRNISSIVKNIFKNPLILGCLIGVLLNRVNTFIPTSCVHFLDYLGNASLPLSLMCVGAGLSFQHLYRKRMAVLSASLSKLIILPVIAFILLSAFNVAGLPKLIAMLYSSVPCAGNAYILAQQMGGDAETMAAIISATTLLSILTIPLILNWVG